MPVKAAAFLVLFRTVIWTICPVKVTSIFAVKKINLTLLKGKQQKHKGQQAQVPTTVIPVRYEKNIFSM